MKTWWRNNVEEVKAEEMVDSRRETRGMKGQIEQSQTCTV